MGVLFRWRLLAAAPGDTTNPRRRVNRKLAKMAKNVNFL
jgi:hypothetical protein